MEFNNPASRLYSILTALKAANQSQATSIVLAECLGVNQAPKELMHAIVKFHELVKEVTEYATKTNLPAGPLARYIPQIESAVGFTNLDAAWASYRDRITAECLVTLEMIAQIDNVSQDSDIPLDQLKSLEQSLTELFEQTESETGLDKEFKFFVLSQIEKIRRSISEYRISGASGFSRYIESLIIDVSKKSELVKKTQNSRSSVMVKFKSIVKVISVFASATDGGLLALKNMKDIYDIGQGLLSDKEVAEELDSEAINT